MLAHPLIFYLIYLFGKLKNVEKMEYLFGGCSLLKSLHDISKWKINKVKSFKGLFYECSNL